MTVGDSDGDASLVEILGESRVRRIPEDFALVARTLILLNGLSHRLLPGRRLIQAELLQHLAAGAAREAVDPPRAPRPVGSGPPAPPAPEPRQQR
jgi:ubiquinone biosynthesis protein